MAFQTSQLRQLLRRNVFFGLVDADDALCDATLGQHPSITRPAFKTGADAAATTAYRLIVDTSTACPALVQSAAVVMDSAVTLNGANYATISLVYNNGLGGADTTVASFNTSATTTVAGVANALTLTNANLYIPAGSQVVWVITKAGTGVSLTNVSLNCRAVYG